MNKYHKLLMVLDVDAQNLPTDDFADAQEMIHFYMRKTDEFIDKVYEEYYGKDKLKPITRPDDDLVRVACECGNEFDLPWDCGMFLDSLNCGQCGEKGGLDVIADPSPTRRRKDDYATSVPCECNAIHPTWRNAEGVCFCQYCGGLKTDDEPKEKP